MKLYRAMIADTDGQPLVKRSARALGVRTPADVALGVDPDVTVAAGYEIIQPGTGGMSAAPNDPANLAKNRRPPQVNGGIGKDPVWEIDTDDLGIVLRYNQDKLTHGTVEVAYPMTLSAYEAALLATRASWSGSSVDGRGEQWQRHSTEFKQRGRLASLLHSTGRLRNSPRKDTHVNASKLHWRRCCSRSVLPEQAMIHKRSSTACGID